MTHVRPDARHNRARKGLFPSAAAARWRSLVRLWRLLGTRAGGPGWKECSVHGWQHTDHGLCEKCYHYSHRTWPVPKASQVNVETHVRLDGAVVAKATIRARKDQ